MRRVILFLALAMLLSACVSRPIRLLGRGGLTWHKVERVISGDMILVNGVGRVKYIGVRAPQRSLSGKSDEPFWEESLQKNRELVEDKWEEDGAGRMLCYVFVQNEEDFREEIFVNGEMLRLGLARYEVSTVNTKYETRLQTQESRARSAGRGIWSLPADKQSK
jgi:endonuclease YncB( thermonuclease family)